LQHNFKQNNDEGEINENDDTVECKEYKNIILISDYKIHINIYYNI
jgi:hypothetical protein